ncbi:MAG: response regulator [Nitrospirota bacterium]
MSSKILNSKKRIMIVEDEAITAMRIQNSLEDMGHIVTSTEFSGKDAIKKAEENRPDLVLMDIVLHGEMDGIEAAGEIRSKYDIPVIYLTAYQDTEILERLKQTEPFGYIAKPFDEEELRNVVDIAVYKHEMESRLRESEGELRNHQEQMKELVEERTSELKKANEKLKHEISERKLAEAEAMRASHLAALGELAAGVAHEINNPAGGIINYAQILINESEKVTQGNDILRRIVKEGDRIAGIVSNLLSFARDNRERKSEVFVHQLVADSLNLAETQLRKDGIKLKVDIPPGLPGVFVQPQQIEQVFLNIISNARYALNQKYQGTHEDKMLHITGQEISENSHKCVRMKFHDHGTGIPLPLMGKIFNPFFTTKPDNVGTGLGLSISHGIIADHEGRLSIDSVEGKFTEVMIELPSC